MSQLIVNLKRIVYDTFTSRFRPPILRHTIFLAIRLLDSSKTCRRILWKLVAPCFRVNNAPLDHKTIRPTRICSLSIMTDHLQKLSRSFSFLVKYPTSRITVFLKCVDLGAYLPVICLSYLKNLTQTRRETFTNLQYCCDAMFINASLFITPILRYIPSNRPYWTLRTCLVSSARQIAAL